MRPDKEGRRWALRITATNDAVGVMPVRSCRGFSDATSQILKTYNLLDHQRLFDVMTGRQVPVDQLKAADILGWESATRSLDEAKQILALMDELGYSWIESPLLPVPFEQQIPKYVELLKTETKQQIQAEGPGSPIGDGTPYDVMRQWAEAGAIRQCSTDVYIANGVTNAWQMIEYAKAHPPLAINLHWSWMSHAHLAMASDERVFPVAEFPMGEELPKELMFGAWLLAPDWPGIYRMVYLIQRLKAEGMSPRTLLEALTFHRETVRMKIGSRRGGS